MSLRLISRAVGYLCSVAQVREILTRVGVSEQSAPDASVQAALQGVRSGFEGEIGRPFLRGTYEESLAGAGRGSVYLTGTPIVASSLAVALDGEEVEDWSLDARSGRLYRSCSYWPERARLGEAGEPNISATYTGGYVAPSLVRDWTAGAAIAKGEWVRHPNLAELLLECTTAGHLGGAEPVWPNADGATVASGTATLTAREAYELPEQLRELAAYSAMTMLQALSAPAGLASLEADGVKAAWFATGAPTAALPEVVCKALTGWRDQL